MYQQTVLQIYNGIPRNIFSIYTTGGGIQSLSWLFTVPGASQSIIQAGKLKIKQLPSLSFFLFLFLALCLYIYLFV